ncbi:Curli production assembly/transport component CsgG [Selenomonas ruminantium]|uniref:Curli production assembly/transport component CsgG n=1 Tax=Selenomonas ruminantium TaxID=971 RepID=A0A1M6RYY1_SELRU|nr:CsgG/HfaB family protein [Selenomonas ruminantium]SHK37676.1 Curli production assembly/transport component CsgG [Selenomonas ruminantium]
MRMVKFLGMLVLWALLLVPQGGCEAALDKARDNVAVLPYAQRAAVSKELSLEDAGMVSEFVIEALLDTGRFNLIERSELLAITEEHKLNMSGLVDQSTAVAVGRLAGVKYLIAGSVTGLSAKKSGMSYENSQAGSVGGKKNTVIANVTLRMIDVETGQIVCAASGTGESASTYAQFKLKKTVTTPVIGEPAASTSSEAVAGTSSEAAESTSSEAVESTSAETETSESETAAGVLDTSLTESATESTTEGTQPVVVQHVQQTVQHTITIGTTEFSQVQVRNALYKAVDDLVFNKKFGFLAKLDGKGQRRRV